SPNDILLLDDGRVQLQVTSVEGNKVHTRVTVGGPLSKHKRSFPKKLSLGTKKGSFTAPLRYRLA
ncbi:hypothetical protein, partial [Vibrio parahaemolyticus]|uniref:hypothetical protein n=1 Tax=Vibrio parahaemolyticus TaxID=670 RepID=UPI00301C0B2A